MIARGLRSAVPIFLFVLCIDACALTFLRKRDEIDEKIAAVPLSLKLALSSPGDYVLEVKATDMNAGRSASRVIPIKVRTATREN